jgi:hypothetical protein
MCMWQSQAFRGAFTFGGSVPDDQGTACCVCPVEALIPPAMTVAPGSYAAPASAGRPDQSKSLPERFKVWRWPTTARF